MLAALTYGKWTPPMLSEHGAGIDKLIDFLHVFMLLLFVVWFVFFVYCLTRFRQRPGHKAMYDEVKAKISKYAEVGVVIFEAFLLVGLSMPVWADYKNEPPAEGDRAEIRVVAQQFQWNIHYPGKDGKFGRTRAELIDEATNPVGLDRDGDPAAADDVVGQELHLPVGQHVYIRLTSLDVIHSFFIPTLRVKQDAVPGMEIPIWFKVQDGKTTETLLSQMTERFPVAGASWYRLRHHVAAEDHAKSGDVLLAKGADLGLSLADGEAALAELAKAGITELVMHPRHPMELVCSQLCGNSHFKMKAAIFTHTPSDYVAWMEEAAKPIEFDDEF